MARLWGITTFFGYGDRAQRLRNFKSFRAYSAAQGLPLCAVELSMQGQPFLLSDSDAEIYRRTESQSVLWHKERLLNIALELLPPECEYVCWIDNDVVFLNDTWISDTVECLEKHPAAQLFEHVFRTPAQYCLDALVQSDYPWAQIPLAYQGDSGSQLFSLAHARRLANLKVFSPGYAWGIRKETIDQVGFYDAGIIGGADQILADALFGRQFRRHTYADCPKFTPSIEQYTAQLGALSNGSVGAVAGRIIHLHHGTWQSRRYLDRYECLRKHGFDPMTDLRMVDGIWEWGTDNTDLIVEVERYFRDRESLETASSGS